MLDQVMEWISTFLAQPDWWKYLLIPVIAAAIGFGTNWLAVQMTFWPPKFIGIWEPYLGWQGVIPRKIEKMSSILVDQTVTKLGTLQEFFKEMEPDAISAHLIEAISARIEEYTDEVMLEKNHILWENLPIIVKKRVYDRARKMVPVLVEDMIKDMSENIEDLVDLKHMIISQLTNDAELLNRVIKEVGHAEFKFVIKSGIMFGFPFGVIQAIVWYIYPSLWILPVFGTLVGAITNMLALNLIFQPLEPKYINLFGKRIKIQGLFLKRQNEVAEVFCRIMTTDMMTLKHLMAAMMNGPKAHRAKAMIKRHIKPFVEGGVVKTLAQITVGPSGYVDLKRTIEEKAYELSVEPFDDPDFNRERGLIVERLFRERMEALTPAEFQDLLRPAFQEDEWILIAIGGVLGFLAGVAQLIFIFGHELTIPF